MSQNRRKRFSVEGFQFEPVRTDPSPNVFYDDDDQMKGIEDESQIIRSVDNTEEWCRCGQYQPMPTREEKICCCDIDEIKYFPLDGEILLPFLPAFLLIIYSFFNITRYLFPFSF